MCEISFIYKRQKFFKECSSFQRLPFYKYTNHFTALKYSFRLQYMLLAIDSDRIIIRSCQLFVHIEICQSIRRTWRIRNTATIHLIYTKNCVNIFRDRLLFATSFARKKIAWVPHVHIPGLKYIISFNPGFRGGNELKIKFKISWEKLEFYQTIVI